MGVDVAVGGKDVAVGVDEGLEVAVDVGAVVGSSVSVAEGVLELVGSGLGDVAVGVGLGPGVLVGAFGSVAVGSIVGDTDLVGTVSNPLVGSGLDGGRMLACWLYIGDGTTVGSSAITVGRAAITTGDEGSSSHAKPSFGMGNAKVSPTSVYFSKSRRISATISFLTDRTCKNPHWLYSAANSVGVLANAIRGVVINAN